RFSKNATEKERLYIEASYASYIENNFEKYSRILHQIALKYPQEKRVHTKLGNFYRRQWLFDEALEAFNKSLEIDPNYGEAIKGLAYTYTDMKEYPKAITHFKEYATLFPDDANTFDSMADLHFFMGNLAEAIASYKKALEIRPIFATSAFKLSYMFALKEDYNDAMKWCDYCVAKAVSPGIAGAGYGFRSFLDYWLGDFTQWQTDFRKMTELYEAAEHKWAVYGMELVKGAIYYELGDFKRSRNSFEISLDSININEPLYAAWRIAYWNSVLGMVDLQEEKLESVRTRMSAIESLIPKVLIPGRDWLAFRRGLLYTELLLRVDSLEKAIDVYTNNTRQPPEVNQPALILANIILPRDVLARVYQRMGKLDKAIAEYERLITYDIPNGDWHLIKPEYHYRLAQLYEQKGRKEKAVDEYKKVVGIWKNTDMYADELEKAKERLRILTNNTL
ncbi:MAG: tetratricopeptide repeat protein, partial [Candidatus Thorarchaeota archaeon]